MLSNILLSTDQKLVLWVAALRIKLIIVSCLTLSNVFYRVVCIILNVRGSVASFDVVTVQVIVSDC